MNKELKIRLSLVGIGATVFIGQWLYKMFQSNRPLWMLPGLACICLIYFLLFSFVLPNSKIDKNVAIFSALAVYIFGIIFAWRHY